MKASNAFGLISLAVLALNPASAQSFSNPASILIPAGAPGTSSGTANPYPSNINVAGLAGTITSLTVELLNFSHTFAADLEILLVGPTSASVLLMNDVGGGDNFVGANLTFIDGGSALVGVAGVIPSGSYSPSGFGTFNMPAPAPAGPYATLLAGFNGTNGNGTWSLYVNDDAGADIGAIAGGYRLNFTTTGTGVPDTGSTLLLLGLTFGGIAAARRRNLRG